MQLRGHYQRQRVYLWCCNRSDSRQWQLSVDLTTTHIIASVATCLIFAILISIICYLRHRYHDYRCRGSICCHCCTYCILSLFVWRFVNISAVRVLRLNDAKRQWQTPMKCQIYEHPKHSYFPVLQNSKCDLSSWLFCVCFRWIQFIGSTAAVILFIKWRHIVWLK